MVRGPGTATALARRLQMTSAGVRKHLDSLVADGLATAGSRPAFGPTPDRGRGRPARVYSLTKAGRDAFEQTYDDLATAALRFLRDRRGSDEIEAFAEARAGETESRYAPIVAVGATTGERAVLLAKALTDDGFAASVAYVSGGDSGTLQICQHNCPVARVAEEFPQLCRAETEALSRLLRVHVTRLATIARGDGICTTLVSGDPVGDSRPPTPERMLS